jgi:hypothetical protein
MADHKLRGGQRQEKKELTLDAGAVLEIIRTPFGNDDVEGLQISLVIRETSLGLARQRFGMNLNSRSRKYR